HGLEERVVVEELVVVVALDGEVREHVAAGKPAERVGLFEQQHAFAGLAETIRGPEARDASADQDRVVRIAHVLLGLRRPTSYRGSPGGAQRKRRETPWDGARAQAGRGK